MGQEILERTYSNDQIALIRNTVAAGTTSDEFNMFTEVCRRVGLDPFRKQIYCVVFGSGSNRKCSFITSIEGYRGLAERQGNYRPDDEPYQIVYDESLMGPDNPLGIEYARVNAYKQDNRGDWHRVVGMAYWHEFAPIIEDVIWEDTGEVWEDSGKKKMKKTGTRGHVLDPKKEKWHKMPKHMLAKCAESQALRKGWPEDLAGVHVAEEFDHVESSNAWEAAEAAERQKRQARLGGPATLFQFEQMGDLVSVPIGEAVDRVLEYVGTAEPAEVDWFRNHNAEALRQLWVHNKTDSLELKKAIEERIQQAEIVDA
jgi:phage recombination protein Bet